LAVVIGEVVLAPSPRFRDRQEAGRELARAVREHVSGPATVLAIPRGGVLVGRPVAEDLSAPLDVVMLRKLPLPRSPEAGFGAVALDGTVVLNEELVLFSRLTADRIDRIVAEVTEEVRRRARVYRGDRLPAPLEGRTVVLVDDGLASGYTMLAALRMVRKSEAERVLVAVPVSPMRSIEMIEREADRLVCLVAQETGSFAVAGFYLDFHDPADEEVLAALNLAERPEFPDTQSR
jgi:putative phosphoribosyl transferase